MRSFNNQKKKIFRESKLEVKPSPDWREWSKDWSITRWTMLLFDWFPVSSLRPLLVSTLDRLPKQFVNYGYCMLAWPTICYDGWIASFLTLLLSSLLVEVYGIDIGSSIKSCPINLKTKCKKKWRWSCRLMKTWHTYNNNIVNLFAKKLIQNLHFYSRYGIFYV